MLNKKNLKKGCLVRVTGIRVKGESIYPENFHKLNGSVGTVFNRRNKNGYVEVSFEGSIGYFEKKNLEVI